ncbi:ATP-binding protein [Streptomyces sp. NPDC046915]|uniref:ATP-binding protein n=1 Tax=Streptomyces sp. NPDC046915 TaxID=3155257 RepID=UPI0033D710BE
MRETHRTESAIGPSDPHRTVPCRPADARRRVRCVVAERCEVQHVHCDTDSVDDALLVVSELTTNAMLHGGGITDFSVDVVGGEVRVSVSDRSDDLPVALSPVDAQGRFRVGGRGWPIVCRLAHDVHVACLPCGGKRITALVPLT